MTASRLTLLLLLLSLSPATIAAVTAKDLPDHTVWYLHADLEALRTSSSGASLYAWFDEEIGAEINEEIGIDLNTEVNSITAYTDARNGTVVVSEGPLTRESQERLLAIATLEAGGDFDVREYKGMTYYHVGDEDDEGYRSDEPFEALEDSAWFSFAIDGKALLTSTEAQLKALLDNGGRIAGAGSHDGAMFVLSADKAFVQAGMQADNMAIEDDDDWESNILRNTRQAAVLLADKDGLIAVQAELVSTDPKMAEAIGGIVNGLISLQAFNSDLEPEIRDLIRNTRVEVKDNTLSINTVIDPDVVAGILSD
ncbi:MAG: hypothetical protein R3192_13780 [Woeseiaceae bacterium]|nr:hypothetical protein [Woeseiaceae bacterium]